MSVINTNIPSITAIHRLSANQNDLKTRLERLSTCTGGFGNNEFTFSRDNRSEHPAPDR